MYISYHRRRLPRDQKVFSFPRNATSLEVKDCKVVGVGVSRVGKLQNLRLQNISDLSLSSTRCLRKDGRLEITLTNVKFHDSLEENTFCGSEIAKIVFENAQIRHIKSMAFHKLSQLETLILKNVSVEAEINYEAFFEVTANRFEIQDSLINRIDPNATCVKVRDLFSVRNTEFSRISEQALYKVTPINNETAIEIVDIIIQYFEPGALQLALPFTKESNNIMFKDNLIDRQCDCDMYHICNKSNIHTGHDGPVLQSIKCFDHGHMVHWNGYDQDHCEEHNHIFSYDGENLTIAGTLLYVFLAVMILLFVILVTVYIICWKLRRPQIVPLLPTGNDDGNWQETREVSILF